MSLNINRLHKVSQLFQPLNYLPKDANVRNEITSKSYKLMIDMGIIRQANVGMYALLPLGIRVLQKLINLVDYEMAHVGAQKMLLPALTSTKLWEKTNRLNSNSSELFTLFDRYDKQYILSPTYEEAISELICSVGVLSPKDVPLRLYQISSKWRDEMKPRLGLLRGREFIMKDLYTFDINLNEAENTYEQVCHVYQNLLKQIGVDFVKVLGDNGMIGGSISHEYHYLSSIGEDIIMSCESCGFRANANVHEKSTCPECENSLMKDKAIEVGHTFLLGTKYSEPLNATCIDHGERKHLVMGCYGLGLTRIIAATVELLSTELELRWPKHLAPFNVCIIPPKEGSKEIASMQYVDIIHQILSRLNIDTILDDRINLTIGKRMVYARRSGYPYIIVIGKLAMQPVPQFEVFDVNNGTELILNSEELSNYFSQNTELDIKEQRAQL
ncbi:probable proline--tRNA ligase, mitochondrial [Orussus abietinus]|uniref:probable proline--tRNA ligase, mitochondrial n=1 Tax=Orussus abietinus TaxID=222816 RepID=UPI000625ABBC|nr:probable proline--tRNA ligase, mitochondrial [Orussus abietinus]